MTPVSTQQPTAFLFLVDQSLSMKMPMAGGGGKSKAQCVADAVNRLLTDLVYLTTFGAEVKDRFHVGVIGFGEAVGPILPDPLDDALTVPISRLAAHPRRLDEERTPVTTPDGRTVEKVVRRPVWVDPAANGDTPMAAAFRMATRATTEFVTAFPRSFPPTVILITDGRPSFEDPREAAAELRRVSTADGPVLLFCVHVSEKPGAPLLYPSELLPQADKYTRFLFQLSSPLPDRVRANSASGYPLEDGARGFAFNADLPSFTGFVNLGTSIAGPVRHNPTNWS
jgi:hypothetical protein